MGSKVSKEAHKKKIIQYPKTTIKTNKQEFDKNVCAFGVLEGYKYTVWRRVNGGSMGLNFKSAKNALTLRGDNFDYLDNSFVGSSG